MNNDKQKNLKNYCSKIKSLLQNPTKIDLLMTESKERITPIQLRVQTSADRPAP